MWKSGKKRYVVKRRRNRNRKWEEIGIGERENSVTWTNQE